MTFAISWFIVLMQFLWKYVDELVGKGLSLWIVGKIVFYAAMSLVPLALPLGILLASLMFFGQIGERLELLAMKASGVPLYRIMAPLFATVTLLSVGLFYFENTYMITSQVRMWTLLYSARFAKPELEIPERTFYNGIPGYSIYVGQRDQQHTGRMHDIMIYDHQQGNEKTRIIRADSGRITMDDSQQFLTWRLYEGQSFENMGRPTTPSDPKPSAYAKERFDYKEIVIAFDANFKVQDESDMRGRFIGKNLSQLNYAIDTTTRAIDSLRTMAASQIVELADRQSYSYSLPSRFDTTSTAQQQRELMLGSDTISTGLTLDSLMRHASIHDSLNIMRTALSQLSMIRTESQSRLDIDRGAYFEYRTNRQEWHKKFTFPVACLVFFFIGAPLGAIIRKGGLGVPVLTSVAFFITYYIIDTFGQNMIRSEKIGVVPGMWLSTLVLLPIGIVLTWQATRDSASLNTEAYGVFFRRLFGTARVRKLEYQELALEEVNYTKAQSELDKLLAYIDELLASPWLSKRFLWQRLLLERWVYSPTEPIMGHAYQASEDLISELHYTRQRMEFAKLQDLPILSQRIIPRILPDQASYRWGLRLLNIVLPLSLPLIWLLDIRRRASLRDLKTSRRLLLELRDEINKHHGGQTSDLTYND